MIYNDEQWAVISKAAPHFETARHEYIRNAPRGLSEEVINVYETATGKKILNRNLGCAHCVLRIYQTIGKTYFSDLEERNNQLKSIEDEKGNNNKENGTPDNGNQKKKKGSSSKVQGRVVKKKNC